MTQLDDDGMAVRAKIYELENIRKVFALYVTFPKSRWDEIKRAETTGKIYRNLMKEYSSKELFNRKNREQIIEAKEVFINDEEAIVV